MGNLENANKKEKLGLLVFGGIIFLVMAVTWIFGGSALPAMVKNDWLFAVLVILGTAASFVFGYYAIAKYQNPNYDWLRWAWIIAAIVVIVILGPYAAQRKADRADNIEAPAK